MMPESSLGARPVSRSTIHLLGFFNLLLRICVNIFFILAQTSFLKQAGVTGLPYIYTTMNILYLALQGVTIRRLGGKSRMYLNRLLIVFLLLLAMRLVVGDDLGIPAVCFFLLAVMVFELLFNQFFTHFLNGVLPMQEAKEHLPLIVAYGSLSFILSGLFLKVGLTAFSIVGLLQAILLLFTVCLLLWNWLSKKASRLGSDLDRSVPDQTGTRPPTDLPRFARQLGFLLAIFTLGKYWLDYQYSKAITDHFSTQVELASFIALFTSGTDFLILSAQTLLAGRVLKRVPLLAVLGFLPLVCTLGSLTAAFSGHWWGIVATQFLFTLFAKTFFQPTFSLITGVFPDSIRMRAMSWTSMAASTGSLAAGVSLILCQRLLSPAMALLGLAVSFAGMVVLLLNMRISYRESLQNALHGADRNVRLQAARELVSFPYDERREHLTGLLAGGEEDRLLALENLHFLTAAHAQEHLLALIQHDPSEHVRSRAIKAWVEIDSPSCRELSRDLLRNADLPARSLSNLVEALAEVGLGYAFLPAIRPLLHHPHHRVRASSLYALLRLSTQQPDLESALAVLRRLIADRSSAKARGAGYHALGRLQHPAFLPDLFAALKDPDPKVVEVALAALGNFPMLSTVLRLQGMAGDEVLSPHLRELARRQAERLAQISAGTVRQLLSALQAGERRELLQVWSDVADVGSIPLLKAALRSSDETWRGIWVTYSRRDCDPWMTDVLSRTIADSGETFLEPLWQGISREHALPWYDLAYLAETFRRGNRLIEQSILLQKLMRNLFRVFTQLAELDRRHLDHPFLRAGWKILDRAARLLATTISNRAGDPSRVLAALERSYGTDRFARQLGLELLSQDLGPELGESVAHFLHPILIRKVEPLTSEEESPPVDQEDNLPRRDPGNNFPQVVSGDNSPIIENCSGQRPNSDAGPVPDFLESLARRNPMLVEV